MPHLGLLVHHQEAPQVKDWGKKNLTLRKEAGIKSFQLKGKVEVTNEGNVVESLDHGNMPVYFSNPFSHHAQRLQLKGTLISDLMSKGHWCPTSRSTESIVASHTN